MDLQLNGNSITKYISILNLGDGFVFQKAKKVLRKVKKDSNLLKTNPGQFFLVGRAKMRPIQNLDTVKQISFQVIICLP